MRYHCAPWTELFSQEVIEGGKKHLSQSRIPSSTSSSSSSSKSFNRRACCASLLFFCHNLYSKAQNATVANIPRHTRATVKPTCPFDVLWLAASAPFLELKDGELSAEPASKFQMIILWSGSQLIVLLTTWASLTTLPCLSFHPWCS